MVIPSLPGLSWNIQSTRPTCWNIEILDLFGGSGNLLDVCFRFSFLVFSVGIYGEKEERVLILNLCERRWKTCARWAALARAWVSAQCVRTWCTVLDTSAVHLFGAPSSFAPPPRPSRSTASPTSCRLPRCGAVARCHGTVVDANRRSSSRSLVCGGCPSRTRRKCTRTTGTEASQLSHVAALAV